MKLEGKVAIITGSSRGIGACIARRYGAEGARVAVVAHSNLDKAEAVVKEINDAGGEAKAFQADVTQVSECDRLAGEVIAAFGTVDILVNNAGIFTAVPIEDTTEEIWDTQIDLNLKGSFFMARAVVPTMKAKGNGKIINITSIAGVGGFPNSGAYCSSKGGQVNMVNALCLELAKDGINVNSLAPGNIKTDMNAPYRAEAGYDESNPLKTTMQLVALTAVPAGTDVQQAIAGFWRDIGVVVEETSPDNADRRAKQREMHWDNHVYPVSTSGAQLVTVQVYGSSIIPVLYLGMQTPEAEAFMREALSSNTPQDRDDVLRTVGDLYYDLYQDIPLFYLPNEVVGNPDIVSDYIFSGMVSGAPVDHLEGLVAK